MLQEHGIRPIVTATANQRGRLERHGGIAKEMLSRIDAEKQLKSLADIETALQQVFRATHTMSNIGGYSPEQSVLGISSRLPGSLVSDEQTTAHLLTESDGPAADRFRRTLELRVAARAAFVHADNHSAIRRAALHQSRGVTHERTTGQLCMYFNKRKAANILERGRWSGPAQVVSHESRSIIWVTHANRLLRCSKENLRPISLRELQQRTILNPSLDNERLKEMARRLQHQLREKSGLFQYVDLSDISPPNFPPGEF